MNTCGACGEDFGSLTAFDAHRVGRHDFTYTEGLAMRPPREDGRRCLTVAEMNAEGFTRNRRGRWSKENALLDARRRLGVDPQPRRAVTVADDGRAAAA
jgi:hypothetical protein